MSVSLYLAPSAHGKTEYALRRVHEAARSLTERPRVCVANRRQMDSWRRRLAEKGGCLGLQLLSFHELYEECLGAGSSRPTILNEDLQFRLVRSVVLGVPLSHYAPIADLPGFIQEVQGTILELKAARVSPAAFQAALDDLAVRGPFGESHRRQGELAPIYAAYERRLEEGDWVDRPGLGWRALEALSRQAPHLRWGLAVFDGFDNFTQTQLDFLALLAVIANPLLISHTGEMTGQQVRRAHQRLEEILKVNAQPLPESSPPADSTLSHLEKNLFRFPAEKRERQPALRLVAVPDHVAEVRVALGWLKRLIAEGGSKPHQVALLARDLAPYRPLRKLLPNSVCF